ncbi:hypothetical protein LCGC14_1151330, partial [marine sediment metagenome]
CDDNMVIGNYAVGNVTGARLDSGTLTYSVNNWGGGVVANSMGWSFATIQDSVDDVEAGTIGGRVFIPAGTWPEAVTVEDSSIEIFGEGAATLIQPLGGTGHGIFIIGDYDDIHIHDLAIDTKTNASGGSGIRIQDGSDRFWIESVIIVDSDAEGIRIEGTTITGGSIVNCVVLSADVNGIIIDMDPGEYAYEIYIIGNMISGTTSNGLATDLSGGNERCIISSNTVTGTGGMGIHCRSQLRSIITNNICISNTADGIKIRDSNWMIVANNLCLSQVWRGIHLQNAENNNISGNICLLNDTGTTAAFDGIFIDAASHFNLVSVNNCLQNDRDGIRVEGDSNRVTNNICNTNGDYGISTAAVADSNFVQDNTLEGNTLGPFNDLGTGTKLATEKGSFEKFGGGSAGIIAPVINTSPGGIDLDGNDEFCYDTITLPAKLQQVVRIKIWAYSNVIEAANNMLLRIVAHGAASSELWSGNAVDVPNHPSEETGGIVQYDVIHWSIDATDDAQIGTLSGQDLVELMAVGEVAGAPDIATDALLGGWEIEYV